ncbi:MAG TPA: glycosyltransferase family 39 protein [Bacteroidales bacterium]|nr:glycosyltransferase family 39 protein [Bacteroidales bacterium]HPS62250.1 glycosyltransferase family 39 protein [Bacteroidales bacterium]
MVPGIRKKLTSPDFLLFSGLVSLNLILKGIYLGANSIAGDEPFSIYFAQMGVSDLISCLKDGNNPPLFEILLHYWIRMFGITPVAVRTLPMVFSALTAGIIYRIGADHFGKPSAIIAALLFTFSNYHTGFAHETRVYSLFALLTVTSMAGFLRMASGRNTRSAFVWMTLSNILLGYAHYLGFAVAILQAIVLLLSREVRNRAGKALFVSLVLCLAVASPSLLTAAVRFRQSAAGGTWVPPSSWEDLYTMLWRWSNAPVTTVLILAFLMAAAGKAWSSKSFRPALPLKILLTWFFLPFLAMHLISLRNFPYHVPMFLDRYVVFISPAFYLLVGGACSYLAGKAILFRIISVAPVIVMLGTFRPDVSNKREVEPLMKEVQSRKDEKTAVCFCPSAFRYNFLYYYDPGTFRSTALDPSGKLLQAYFLAHKIYPADHAGELRTDSVSRVLYLDAGADFASPGNNILNDLTARMGTPVKAEFPEIFKLYVFENR